MVYIYTQKRLLDPKKIFLGRRPPTVYIRADVTLFFGNNSLTKRRTKLIFGQSKFYTPT